MLFIYACPSGGEEGEGRNKEQNPPRIYSDKMETFSEITFRYQVLLGEMAASNIHLLIPLHHSIMKDCSI